MSCSLSQIEIWVFSKAIVRLRGQKKRTSPSYQVRLLAPSPADLCFEQAASRFMEATLILQQIAARIDAADKAQVEEAKVQEVARTVAMACEDTTQKTP